MSSIYCTYLTTYTGSRLPIWYIGSSTTQKIESGYHGSVKSKKYRKIWEEELTNNPNLFKTKIISKHNTRKEALEKELKLHLLLNVVKSPMYINQSLATVNGYFGSDVTKTSNPFYNKKHSEEQKQKWSIDRKGVIPWNKGIPMDELQKQKLRKLRTEDQKEKLRKPKSNSFNMGRYERTNEKRIEISERIKSLPKIHCIYCDKMFDKLNYNKWHGDNCKHKPL